MIIYIDLDGTLCKTEGSDYVHATPNQKNICKVNALFDQGHTIIIWTARGTTETDRGWFECTLGQLYLWGIKYNELRMGKPYYDLWIDDKCENWKSEN